jgi:hypothetical protein
MKKPLPVLPKPDYIGVAPDDLPYNEARKE